MTGVYGGLVLIAVVAGILFIAGQGRPVLRPKRNVNGSDSDAYLSHTYRGDDRSGSDTDSGTDGGSSGGGDGGGGGGGD